MLYFRMFITMGIALYTSRVVLNQLGVVDFGVFNVVGGLVSMMAFLNASMSLASQRYFAYDIGCGNQTQLQRTFSTAVNVHLVIALISILLAETLGLWVFWKFLDIPAESRGAAIWVFHLAIFQMALGIITVPFSSLAVAFEKMSSFAYISILESVLKLSVAFLLTWILYNKLILYSILLASATSIISTTWIIYDYHKFKHCRYIRLWDKSVFRQLLSFMGWQTVGSLTWMLRTQGINVILNSFFGPVVNAARGIAVQVNTAVMQFVSNFQMASNPQITKHYAAGELPAMCNLIMRSSKISFLLMFVISLPIIIETEPILRLWLKIIPDYGVIFVRLMLISTLCDLLSGTLVYGALATGKIKRYQLIISSILILEVVVAVIAYKMGYAPQSVFYIEMVLYLVTLAARLLLLRRMIGLSIRAFASTVLLPEIKVILMALAITLCIDRLLSGSPASTVIVMASSVATALVSAYFLGLTRHERQWITEKVKTRLTSSTPKH